MKLNNYFIKTGRLFNLLFKMIMKDYKIYIVSIFIPVVISFLIYWIWGTIIISGIFTPQMFSFMSVGTIVITFYLTILVGEWKSTNFLKQIKASKNGVLNLVLVLSLISIVLSLISAISSIVVALISTSLIPLFPVNYSITFANIDWWIWFDYFLIIAVMSFVSLISFLCISNLGGNKYLNIALSISLLIFFFFFSDIVIIPYFSSQVKVYSIIQYLNPLKYVVWIIFMISSYQVWDSMGIQKIMSTNNTSTIYISFTNIWVPIFIVFIFSIFSVLYIKYRFVWGVKS